MSKFCLSFDTDWCPQEHIDYTVALLEKHNLNANFFLTNNFSKVDYEKAEIGIHPDLEFNSEDEIKKRVEELLNHYHEYDPKGVRVHRLYSSAPLNAIFSEFGLKYQSNYTIYMEQKDPFVGLYNIVEAPIYFREKIRPL